MTATYTYLGSYVGSEEWTEEERRVMTASLPSSGLDVLLTDLLDLPWGMYSDRRRQQWMEVLDRMSALGWHARLLTPFKPGALYFAGFTPHVTSGWNGRPDHEVGDEQLVWAVCRAAAMTILVDRRMKQEMTEEHA